MKKYIVLCVGLCLAMCFTGCKSSESAYKKAYEKAQAQTGMQVANPVQQQVTEIPVVTPVVTTATNRAQVVDNSDNVVVRQERVSMIYGTGLKNYSVVVGSFSVVANAEGLQQRLQNAGYASQIVKNEDRNMYRVIASTFDSKADAVQSRDQLRATYPDAWLLFNAR